MTFRVSETQLIIYTKACRRKENTATICPDELKAVYSV